MYTREQKQKAHKNENSLICRAFSIVGDFSPLPLFRVLLMLLQFCSGSKSKIYVDVNKDEKSLWKDVTGWNLIFIRFKNKPIKFIEEVIKTNQIPVTFFPLRNMAVAPSKWAWSLWRKGSLNMRWLPRGHCDVSCRRDTAVHFLCLLSSHSSISSLFMLTQRSRHQALPSPCCTER